MTPKQCEVLNAIKNLTRDGVSPTYAEIGAEVGLSRSNVFRHLHLLAEQGKIVLTPNAVRAIQVVDDDEAPYVLARLKALSTPRLKVLAQTIDAVLQGRAKSTRHAA